MRGAATTGVPSQHPRPRDRLLTCGLRFDFSTVITHREETQMGIFDGVLGGIVGAGMVSVVSDILEKHGGLQGVVSEFETNGLGATVQSWVGTGPNQTISQDEVHKVLGPELLRQLSEKSGLSVQDLTQKLSHVLPQTVDRLTPDGTIAKA